MKKSFEIWSEGFEATGERGSHYYVGESTGENFIDAIKIYADRNPRFKKLLRIENDRAYYWGCELFDNAQDASRAFG